MNSTRRRWRCEPIERRGITFIREVHDGMSDQPKKREHTTRLALSMVTGMSAGAICMPAYATEPPWRQWAPLLLIVAGAMAGFSIEMLRRLRDRPGCGTFARDLTSGPTIPLLP